MHYTPEHCNLSMVVSNSISLLNKPAMFQMAGGKMAISFKEPWQASLRELLDFGLQEVEPSQKAGSSTTWQVKTGKHRKKREEVNTETAGCPSSKGSFPDTCNHRSSGFSKTKSKAWSHCGAIHTRILGRLLRVAVFAFGLAANSQQHDGTNTYQGIKENRRGPKTNAPNGGGPNSDPTIFGYLSLLTSPSSFGELLH